MPAIVDPWDDEALDLHGKQKQFWTVWIVDVAFLMRRIFSNDDDGVGLFSSLSGRQSLAAAMEYAGIVESAR
jgi:hypothetical protein